MRHPYDKEYLEIARNRLGGFLDLGINSCGYGLEELYNLFLSSSIAKRFEEGDPSLIAGHSLAELLLMIEEEKNRKAPISSYRNMINKSPEFWVGWSLAFYQWNSGLTFKKIQKFAYISDVLNIYNPYHEMDIRQFVDLLDSWRRSKSGPTKLQSLRKQKGYSQAELAYLSKVSKRSIQQYEQRQKDLNKASGTTILSLSKALGCPMEELME